MIQSICQLLKDELLDNGYEYGFYLNGKTYKPDMSNGFDEEFFDRLLSDYRIQAPRDTRQAKVGTCNDIVILMKAILDEQNVPSKIWLLHDRQSGKFHTVLTFYIEDKTIYLELTPRSAKPWYGKEIVFDDEQSFISEYSKDGCEVIEITDSVIVGEAPEFILSRMDQTEEHFLIRKAAIEDISRIAEILVFVKRMNYRAIFRNDAVSFSEIQVIPVAGQYSKPEILESIWVYEAEGIVKGLIRIVGNEVVELYVEHFFQGQGIGAELIEFAKKEKDARFLWVLEKNADAIRFYEAHGFHLTGKRMPEEGTPEYKVLMER